MNLVLRVQRTNSSTLSPFGDGEIAGGRVSTPLTPPPSPNGSRAARSPGFWPQSLPSRRSPEEGSFRPSNTAMQRRLYTATSPKLSCARTWSSRRCLVCAQPRGRATLTPQQAGYFQPAQGHGPSNSPCGSMNCHVCALRFLMPK